MTLAATGLLLNGLLVAVLGVRVLERRARQLTPGQAILAWASAMAAVLISWFTAAGLAGVALLRSGGHLHAFLLGCLSTLGVPTTGRYGELMQDGVDSAVVLAVLAAVVLLGRFLFILARSRSRTHQHCALARLVSEPRPGPGGALLLDSSERHVYCVAGRPAAIVVTQGAIDALDEAQLAAVLAHERAHLAERHHLLVAASRGAAAILPHVRLLSVGAQAIAHYVEMRADDLALRRHRGTVLIGALLALSDGGTLSNTVLSASSTGVVERVERLLLPACRRQRSSWAVPSLAVAALLAGPALSMALLAAVATLCQDILG